MFERLIDLLASGWDYIAPFVVIDAYQGAVVLRFGRYSRTLEAGFHWKWPLAERAIEVDTCLTTLRLAPQTLTSHDGKSLVVAAIVKYRIVDPKPYVIGILDQVDVLADVSMGAIAQCVRAVDAATLFSDPPEGKVATAIRRQVNRFGFEIEAVTFTDLGRVNSLRLIQPHGVSLGN